MNGQERACRRERGANLIEFALSITLLLVILGGVVDVGRAFHSYVTITNAAREGARHGSKYPRDDENIREAVLREAENSGVDLEREGADIAIEYDANSGTHLVRVTVSYPLETIMGGFVGLDVINMARSVEMATGAPPSPPVTK